MNPSGKLSLKNFSAFVLMLSGAMAFGSLYTALLNKVGKDLTVMNMIICALMLVFIFVGAYCYRYLSFGKGNKIVALILVSIVAILNILSMSGGYSSDQKWFAAHEILNLVSSIVLVIIFIMEMMKKS